MTKLEPLGITSDGTKCPNCGSEQVSVTEDLAEIDRCSVLECDTCRRVFLLFDKTTISLDALKNIAERLDIQLRYRLPTPNWADDVSKFTTSDYEKLKQRMAEYRRAKDVKP